jgi:hypothetical protein
MLADADIQRLSTMTDAELASLLQSDARSFDGTSSSPAAATATVPERVMTAMIRNIMTSEDRTRPPRPANIVAFLPASSIYSAAGAYAPTASSSSSTQASAPGMRAAAAADDPGFEHFYSHSIHVPYERTPDTLDIMRIVHDLDPEHDADEETWNGDTERGSVECGEALTEMGVCIADLDAARETIKRVIVDTYDTYIKAAARLDTANRTNDMLTKWMMDFECNIGPHIAIEHGPEHTEATRGVIDALVEAMRDLASHHAEVTAIGQLRTARAHAFGALQRAIRTVKTTPDAIVGSVCCICIDRTCDRAIIPCGHVICSTCYAKSNGIVSTCYMCRAPVERVVRLYMN